MSESRYNIAIGADHGGVELKDAIAHHLIAMGHKVVDFGTHSKDSVDYADFANEVAIEVSQEQFDFGVLCCTSGVGVSMAANRYTGIRAANVRSVSETVIAREHNNANILCLGQQHLNQDVALSMVDAFLATDFEGGRHTARIKKASGSRIAVSDPVIFDAIHAEGLRQRNNIELIASENFTSLAVQEAQGGLLTNKYAEGYPGRRWYGGCENVDIVETIAIDRLKQLFGAEHANVQPHSGSQANTAVYFSVLKHGDKILTMDLAHGGHLTHGHKANFSGKFYEVKHYGVSEKDARIDYDALEQSAVEFKPALITTGASAYSREIDFERMGAIAKKVGAYLFVDMAHIAGLVAAGVHQSPVPYADFVTSTTHKSLRGPRGGVILCKAEHAKKIDSTVFPGIQGGPLMHVIAGKAICFGEALKPEFKEYSAQVIKNAQTMANRLAEHGYHIVSGGTDNHLFLIDFRPNGIDGAIVSTALDEAGITVNKNSIPFDTAGPFKPSGIRIGTPAVTTRGMKEVDVTQVADFIHAAIEARDDEAKLEEIRNQVFELNRAFPLPR